MSAENLRGRWIGDLRGTIIGNLFVVFDEGAERSVELTVNSGGRVLSLKGAITEAPGILGASLEGIVDNETGSPKRIIATLIFEEAVPEKIIGRWDVDDGNRGIFMLSPGVKPEGEKDSKGAMDPVQIVRRSANLSKIIMYKDDIDRLVLVMKSLLPSTFEVVIRSKVNGKDVSRLESGFWILPALPDRVEYLYLTLSEPGGIGPRTININLSSDDCSYSVSAANDIWVNGTFYELEQFFRNKHSRIRWIYEKYAKAVNIVIFVMGVVWVPDLPMPSRIILFSFIIFFMVIFKLLHEKTTELRVFLKTQYKEISLFDVQKISTAAFGALISLAIPWFSTFLKDGNLQRLLKWFTNGGE
jgi:hypothetical protein